MKQLAYRSFRHAGSDRGVGGRSRGSTGWFRRVENTPRGGEPRLEGLVPLSEVLGVERRAAHAKGQGGPSRVGISGTPLRCG